MLSCCGRSCLLCPSVTIEASASPSFPGSSLSLQLCPAIRCGLSHAFHTVPPIPVPVARVAQGLQLRGATTTPVHQRELLESCSSLGGPRRAALDASCGGGSYVRTGRTRIR